MWLNILHFGDLLWFGVIFLSLQTMMNAWWWIFVEMVHVPTILAASTVNVLKGFYQDPMKCVMVGFITIYDILTE